MLIYEEVKQVYDGDGRKTVVENGSYGEPEGFHTYENVLRACEELEAYYENIKDSGKLGALSKELDAIEDDFSKVERIVKGYLSSMSRSSAEDQMKRLREEITKQKKSSYESNKKSSELLLNMRSNLHRTFETSNQRQDQTKEQKQLASVNYATKNERESCYRNKILLLKRSLLYLRALEF